MERSDDGPRFSRRTILGQAATAGSALALGAGAGTTAAAPAGCETIDVEVWFADAAHPNTSKSLLNDAAAEVSNQANVETNVRQFQNTSHSYDTNDAGEIFEQFRSNEGSDIDAGQLNLLIVSHSPDSGVVGLNHDGELRRDSAPVVVLNDWFTAVSDRAFKNLAITGFARPIAGAHADDAPASGDVNSFGTVYTHDWSANEVSPLASWHTPKVAECLMKLPALDGSADNVDACCGHDDVPYSCGFSGDLSDCTKQVLEHQMCNEYLQGSKAITVEGTQSGYSDYTLEVTGSLEKTTAMGASINGGDTIQDTSAGQRVDGSVWRGRDSYEYTGQIETFRFEAADHVVYVDGEEVKPWSLKFDTVAISNAGSGWSSYDLAVTSTLRGESNINDHDDLDGDRSASGHVSSGTDVYTYYGGVVEGQSDLDAVSTDFSDDGTPYLNGA